VDRRPAEWRGTPADAVPAAEPGAGMALVPVAADA